jgi:hypothetical protein
MNKKICKTCEKEKNVIDFPKYYGKKKRTIKYRPHCKKCTYILEKERKTEEQKQNTRNYQKEYHKKNPLNAKVKSYQFHDRKFNRKSISLPEARNLIKGGVCRYCGNDKERELGLDRIDNAKGHELNNVVVCCEKCNFILSDIPEKAKVRLIDGLTNIYKNGDLKEWTIPTKRKK